MASERCCPTDKPGVKGHYHPKGLNVYETGPEDAKSAIVYITDIFGMSPQAYEVADRIAASTHTKVFVPDVFHGKPWPHLDAFDGLGDWLKKEADWETKMKPIVKELSTRLRRSYARVGALGFCWGAKVCVQAFNAGYVDVMASPHPSFLTAADFEKMPGPVCLLPSKDEKHYEPIISAIKGNEKYGAKSIVTTFPTMHHGWMAARGDFHDPENKKKLDEGLDILTKFFKDTLH